MGVFRAGGDAPVPTALRSSALSILAAAVEVSLDAVKPWLDTLVAGAADVVRVEIVPFNAVAAKPPQAQENGENGSGDKKVVVDRHTAEDNVEATTLSTKAPTLRRSALHLIALVLKTLIQKHHNSYEEQGTSSNFDMTPSIVLPTTRGPVFGTRAVPPSSTSSSFQLDQDLTRLLGTIIRYARDVDIDGIVRDQAAECSDLLDQYLQLWLGV